MSPPRHEFGQRRRLVEVVPSRVRRTQRSPSLAYSSSEEEESPVTDPRITEFRPSDGSILSSSKPGRYQPSKTRKQSPRGYLDHLGPVTDPRVTEFRPSDGRILSTSEPGRYPPSETRKQRTRGYLDYPEGFPAENSGLRAQSATGYGATPDEPRGTAYETRKPPFRHGSQIHKEYSDYKEADKKYAGLKTKYKIRGRELEATKDEPDFVNTLVDGRLYTQRGHAAMSDIAHDMNIAGITAATKRLEFSSKNYARTPREGHPGHLEQARDLATKCGRESPPLLSRKHEYLARGGDGRGWNQTFPDYEISKKEWKEIEDQQNARKRSARDHDTTAKARGEGGNEKGPKLKEGRYGPVYEWLHVGGGRRRYWSDHYDDYVEHEKLKRHPNKASR